MKVKLQPGFLVLALLICSFSQAQSYIGHTMDHYSGIQGITFNPSSVVDSRQRADINLLSFSVFGGSDYFSMGLESLLESEDGFTFEDDVEQSPTDNNQFFLNADILGPSFMFNLTPRSSIGVFTRGRVFFNLNNINGTLYENISDEFDASENFDFDLENFSGTIHAWTEIGLTYGRVFVNNQSNFFKGGVTLKYLQGAGSTFINAPSATGQYDAATQMLMSSGTLSYGATPGFDNEDIDLSNLSSGFGADIGFTYEYRPNYAFDSRVDFHSDYKFRLGVSITDFGSISYEGSNVTTYDLNRTIDKSQFEDEDFETVLEENYQGTEAIVNSKINLPTAMHAFLDYRVENRLFVSLQGSFSLVADSKEQANRIINTLTATPRYQSRWFSFYLPMSLRQYDGFVMGAGLRLGPVSVGSGSLITTYLSDSSSTTDIYVGLKIPLYR